MLSNTNTIISVLKTRLRISFYFHLKNEKGIQCLSISVDGTKVLEYASRHERDERNRCKQTVKSLSACNDANCRNRLIFSSDYLPHHCPFKFCISPFECGLLYFCFFFPDCNCNYYYWFVPLLIYPLFCASGISRFLEWGMPSVNAALLCWNIILFLLFIPCNQLTICIYTRATTLYSVVIICFCL
jgi:hypothetical protein